jgi:hypothetical protein
VKYDEVIRVWDVDSGGLLRTMQHSTPRGMRSLELAPDASYFLTHDDVPGEFETDRPRAQSLWDTASGRNRQVAEGNAYVNAISPDSKWVAVSVPAHRRGFLL